MINIQKRFVAVAALGVGLATVGIAAETKEGRNERPTKAAEAKKDGSSKIAERIAERRGIETEAVLELREQGYGWGEIDNAAAIAAASDTSLDEIIDLRDSGIGWDQIAEDQGVNLGELKSNEKARSKGAKGTKGDNLDEDIRNEDMRDALAPEKKSEKGLRHKRNLKGETAPGVKKAPQPSERPQRPQHLHDGRGIPDKSGGRDLR